VWEPKLTAVFRTNFPHRNFFASFHTPPSSPHHHHRLPPQRPLRPPQLSPPPLFLLRLPSPSIFLSAAPSSTQPLSFPFSLPASPDRLTNTLHPSTVFAHATKSAPHSTHLHLPFPSLPSSFPRISRTFPSVHLIRNQNARRYRTSWRHSHGGSCRPRPR